MAYEYHDFLKSYRDHPYFSSIETLFDDIKYGNFSAMLATIENLPNEQIDFFVKTVYYFLCIQPSRIDRDDVMSAIPELAEYCELVSSLPVEMSEVSRENIATIFVVKLLKYAIDTDLERFIHSDLFYSKNTNIRELVYFNRLMSEQDFNDLILLSDLNEAIRSNKYEEILEKFVPDKIEDILRVINWDEIPPYGNWTKSTLKDLLRKSQKFNELYVLL